MSVDPRAASGFAGFADEYQRARPGYPRPAVADLARELGIADASTVLDLAAGTGKLTQLLVALAGRVIAVDPSDAMRARLGAQMPEVELLRGTAEHLPLGDASVDAVFVGQAFHWFRAEQACEEIARVLAPGGGLALLWNRACWEDAGLGWMAEFEALTGPHRPEPSGYPNGVDWREALMATELFAPLSSTEASHTQRLAAAEFPALVSSWSWIANLPVMEREALLRRVGELAGTEGELALPYRTEIHWTRRLLLSAAPHVESLTGSPHDS